jgi:hypothetical protein
MNLFGLHPLARKSAILLCPTHQRKMLVETVQVLHTVLFLLGLSETGDYRPTHAAHPVVDWARAAANHFDWAVSHARALVEAYHAARAAAGLPARVHACEAPLASAAARADRVRQALPATLAADQWLEGHPRAASLRAKVREVDPPDGCAFGVLASDSDGSPSWVDSYRTMYVKKGERMFLDYGRGLPPELEIARQETGVSLLTHRPKKRKSGEIAPNGSE